MTDCIIFTGQSVTPNTLRAVVVPLMNNTVCNDGKHYHGLIDDSAICAGEDQGGKDSCQVKVTPTVYLNLYFRPEVFQGDSGGPLACYDGIKKQWSLVGVVSYGEKCALAYKPGVYGRVTSGLKWILQQIH